MKKPLESLIDLKPTKEYMIVIDSDGCAFDIMGTKQRVNEMVAEVVKNVPPFQFVRKSLEKVFPVADIMVCSATSTQAL